MTKNMWFTQEILFETELFGKKYFWMKDVDGKIYLARAIETPEGILPDPLV